MKNYKKLYHSLKLRVNVDLSTYCNAACPQCHRVNPANIDKKIDWLPLVQTSFKQFQKRFPLNTLNNYREFIFCGTWGDPMMCKDVYEICDYVIKNTVKTDVRLNTNGGIRSEEFWWNLGALNKKYQDTSNSKIYCTFDIDGITEKQHSIYRRNVSLAKVLQNMKTFTSNGATAVVFTVVFKHNEKDIDEIGKLAANNGASFMQICPSNRFNKEYFRFVHKGKLEKLYPSSLPLDNIWVDLSNNKQSKINNE